MPDDHLFTPEEEDSSSSKATDPDRSQSIHRALEGFRRQVHRSRVLREYRRNMAYMVPSGKLAAEHPEVFAQAISKIDEPYQSILVLREIQNLKTGKIAEALDLPTKTVRVYSRRGQKKLRRELHRIRSRKNWKQHIKDSDYTMEEVEPNFSPRKLTSSIPVEGVAQVHRTENPRGHTSELSLSTRLSIAIFESDQARKIATSALLALCIGAIVLAVSYGFSLLSPSGSILNVLILITALASVVGTVLVSDIAFGSDRKRDFKYLF